MAGQSYDTTNFDSATSDLKLNKQEQALYQRHLQNLWGIGGTNNADGSRSSLYQSVQEHNGKFYNVPTVWNGKRETVSYTNPQTGESFDVPNATAMKNIEAEGWDTFPSYDTAEEADQRYSDMHGYMDKDTASYMQQRNNSSDDDVPGYAEGGTVLPSFDDMPSFDDIPDSQQAPQPERPLMFDDLPSFDDMPGNQPQSQPQAESELKTFGREAAHGVLPAAGGIVAGAGLGFLGGSVFPGVGNVVGAIAGGIAGAYGTSKLQEAGLKAAGYDDSQLRAANAEVNPKSAMAGAMAPALATMRPDRAATALQRGISGGLMGGINAGQQYAETGKVNPGEVAAQAVAGAALPSFNRVGQRLEAAGQGLANKVAGRPNVDLNPAAQPAQDEAQVSQQPVVEGEAATVQTAPPETGDTIGNPQSSPERSERTYGKEAAPSEQGDMLTTGDVDPATAAALEDQAPRPEPQQAQAPDQLQVVRPAEHPEGVQLPAEPEQNFGFPQHELPSFDEMPARAKDDKVQAEVGFSEPPKKPPPPEGGEPPEKPTLGPPPPMAQVTKEDLQTGLIPGIQRWLGGRNSPSWRAARNNIMGTQGEAEQMKQTSAARFTNDMHRLVNQTSPAEQRMLVNYIQGGNEFPTYKPSSELKGIVDQIREGYKDFENTMRAMPEFDKMQFWDNDKYLTAQYKNPEAAKDYFKDFSRAGGSGSTKKRFFATDEDARKAGLEPVSTNPIERFLRYADTMSSYLAYRKEIQNGKDSGYIKYFSPQTVAGAGTPEPYIKGKPPEGWAPIDGLVDKGGRQAYAPRDYAAVMNNFHGTGLGRSQTGRDLVSAVRRTSNAFTAMELGIATYHAFTTVHERTASAWSTALSQAAGGDLSAAGKTFAKSLISPVAGVKEGGRLQGLYNGTIKDATPQEKAIIDGMKAANFKPINAKHALDYDMSKAGSLYTSIVRGSLKHEMVAEYKNIVGDKNWKEAMTFVPRNAGRMMQTIAHPLFEFYIPRMKTSAFAENLKAWMDANPDYKPEAMHEAAIRIGKSIDNRMGEMAHDNMMMNRALRDAASIALRSFSFTIGGVFREIGGGTQSLVRGALKGENRLSLASKQYDPRTAYALAFPMAVASMSMLYQYIKTGKGPDDWRDLVWPKTGGEQPGVGKGRSVPERALLPGYHKDIAAYLEHPTREASNKLAGLWQAIGDQIGGTKMTEVGPVPIVPPKATLGEAAVARAKAFGEHATPIFVRTAIKDPRKTSNISYGEQLMGLRSPGKWAADSEGQHRADERRAQRDWNVANKRMNADRQARGLPPIPTNQ